MLDNLPFVGRDQKQAIREIEEAAASQMNTFGSAGASGTHFPGGSVIQQLPVNGPNISFQGVVWSPPGSGSPTLPAHVYWVKSNDITVPYYVSSSPGALGIIDSSAAPDGWYIPVTNLKEVGTIPSPPLAIGSVVTVYALPGPGGLCFFMMEGWGGGSFKARITANSTGSFPVWTYTVQRVVSRNTALTDFTQWVTDGVNITAFNSFEWTPASYPYKHGTGVEVQDNTGAVATTFGGGTAGSCLIRAIGVGAVVDVTQFLDQTGAAVYLFDAPNSAQAS